MEQMEEIKNTMRVFVHEREKLLKCIEEVGCWSVSGKKAKDP